MTNLELIRELIRHPPNDPVFILHGIMRSEAKEVSGTFGQHGKIFIQLYLTETKGTRT